MTLYPKTLKRITDKINSIDQIMKTYILNEETIISKELSEVWTFFSDPHNLSRLTPPYMNFRVQKSPDTKEIFEGMLIEYKVSPLFRIPVKWVTKIQEVSFQNKFQDIQLKGPFAFWEHTHTFEARGNETIMTDYLRYKPPFGLLGKLAYVLFLKKQIQGIFDYRSKVIQDVFHG